MAREADETVRISRWRWRRLIRELARRGRGTRESGAFLLARTAKAPRRVVDVVYFDDLDPGALNGAISIRGEAFGPLWDHCRENGFRVIADVHTHPGPGVAQSSIDRTNPMVARRGHVGIILPRLAQQRPTPTEAGVHVYEGSHRWRSAFDKDAARLLRRTWWPR